MFGLFEVEVGELGDSNDALVIGIGVALAVIALNRTATTATDVVPRREMRFINLVGGWVTGGRISTPRGGTDRWK